MARYLDVKCQPFQIPSGASAVTPAQVVAPAGARPAPVNVETKAPVPHSLQKIDLTTSGATIPTLRITTGEHKEWAWELDSEGDSLEASFVTATAEKRALILATGPAPAGILQARLTITDENGAVRARYTAALPVAAGSTSQAWSVPKVPAGLARFSASWHSTGGSLQVLTGALWK